MADKAKAKASKLARFEVKLANGKTAEEVASSEEAAMEAAASHNKSEALSAKKLFDVDESPED